MTIPFALSGLVASVYSEGSEVRQEPTDEGTRVRALLPPAAAARLSAAIANGAAPG